CAAVPRTLLEGVDHYSDEDIEAARVPLVFEPAPRRLDHVVELGEEVTHARIDADFTGDGVFGPELRSDREAVARVNSDLGTRAEERPVLVIQLDRVEADAR